MSLTSTARVSNRGQTNLPAELRRRWGLVDGGEVGVIDLGNAALIVPEGVGVARREVMQVLVQRYDQGLRAISDPDLADQ